MCALLHPHQGRAQASQLNYPVTPAHIALLLLVSSIAGALNSVAGGGSFISFPTLMFLGMPSVTANATNTTALWPGTIASTGAYRRALNRELLLRMLPLAITTLIGSLVGAWLLLHTHPHTFDKLVPWLLFAGTLLFTLRDRISSWASTRNESSPNSAGRVAWIAMVQGILGIYVGYFG